MKGLYSYAQEKATIMQIEMHQNIKHFFICILLDIPAGNVHGGKKKKNTMARNGW